MKRSWLFVPFGMLTLFAGYLGLRLGQPVSESEIITHFAKVYTQEAGAGTQVSDCLAVPGATPGVRLVVVCTHPSGDIYRYPAGPRGQLRAEPAATAI